MLLKEDTGDFIVDKLLLCLWACKISEEKMKLIIGCSFTNKSEKKVIALTSKYET